jgi:hypothetical protein
MFCSFDSPDCSLPEQVLEKNPTLRLDLQRLSDIELSIQERWMHQQRLAMAASTEPDVHQKVLRIFLRHQLFPATQTEATHFLIRVEGSLLDPKYKLLPSCAFTNFFDKIKVVVDRRYYAQYAHLEWDAAAASAATPPTPAPLQGRRLSPCCVQFKLFGDKPSIVRLVFEKSQRVCQRYEVSIGLREAFPKLRSNPSLEDVVTTVMHYAQTNYLCDKRMIRCNDVLKNIFGVDILTVSSLLQKLRDDHLSSPKPLTVEYPLTSNGSIQIGAMPSTLSKIGGKAFDIEVDVHSEHAFEAQALLNDAAQGFEDSDERLAGLYTLGQYLSRRCHKLQDELNILRDLESNPYRFQLNKPLQVEAMYSLADVSSIVSKRSSYHFIRDGAHASPPSSDNDDDDIDDDGEDEYDDSDGEENDEEKEGVENTEETREKKLPLAVSIPSGGSCSLADDVAAKSVVKRDEEDTTRSRKRVKAPLTMLGSIHPLKGYLDVGNTILFEQSSGAWVQESANHLFESMAPANKRKITDILS